MEPESGELRQLERASDLKREMHETREKFTVRDLKERRDSNSIYDLRFVIFILHPSRPLGGQQTEKFDTDFTDFH